MTALGAILGGGLAAVSVYLIAQSRIGTSVATMLLAGVAITALAGSLTSLVQFFSDSDTLRRISLWQMGSLDGASHFDYQLAFCTLCACMVSLYIYSKKLDALLLGEMEASYLGINVAQLKKQLVAVIALSTGICVALTGAIAFVGLVVPHIMRALCGVTHRRLIPASALAGAILLVLADTLSRSIIAPSEIPIGIFTSILGVPFFIYLIRQRYRYGI